MAITHETRFLPAWKRNLRNVHYFLLELEHERGIWHDQSFRKTAVGSLNQNVLKAYFSWNFSLVYATGCTVLGSQTFFYSFFVLCRVQLLLQWLNHWTFLKQERWTLNQENSKAPWTFSYSLPGKDLWPSTKVTFRPSWDLDHTQFWPLCSSNSSEWTLELKWLSFISSY